MKNVGVKTFSGICGGEDEPPEGGVDPTAGDEGDVGGVGEVGEVGDVGDVGEVGDVGGVGGGGGGGGVCVTVAGLTVSEKAHVPVSPLASWSVPETE